ncbi:MAG: PIN domain-containing protein [Bryobacterales bacterium]|nr:PIN domain-containing protein [Bryobacteraceae bacterium]MDW8352955.1 PIN domain-containing protein [Bryobacterales bacterium]
MPGAGEKTFPKVFVDTNVLIYSVDPRVPSKHASVWRWLTALWETACGRLSWQVLHEFYVNALRKAEVARSEARQVVRSYATWRPVETTLNLVERAWHWADRSQVSYWDALILAAAEASGCAYLLSEDFQDRQRFGSLTVLNPFLHGPEHLGFRFVEGGKALPPKEAAR